MPRSRKRSPKNRSQRKTTRRAAKPGESSRAGAAHKLAARKPAARRSAGKAKASVRNTGQDLRSPAMMESSPPTERQDVITAQAEGRRPDAADPEIGGTGRRGPVETSPPPTSPGRQTAQPARDGPEPSGPSPLWPLESGFQLTRQWMAATWDLWDAAARRLMGMPPSFAASANIRPAV